MEEIKSILTNAELDENAKHEAIQTLINTGYVPAKVHSEEVKKLKGELANKDTEFNQFRISKMSEEEKHAELQRQQEEKNKATNLRLSRILAENVFARAKFDEDDYKGLLDNIVTENVESTEILAKTLCDTMTKQRESVEAKIRESIINKTPKPQGGDDKETPTDVDTLEKALDSARKSRNMIEVAKITRLIAEAKANK